MPVERDRKRDRSWILRFLSLLALVPGTLTGEEPYPVVRHDYVGSLLVYLAGESDGFVVHMPVKQAPDETGISRSLDQGLKIDHTPYRFDWEKRGVFFSGVPRRTERLTPDSVTGFLRELDGKLLFSLRDLVLDGKKYDEIGPVEVTLDRSPRP